MKKLGLVVILVVAAGAMLTQWHSAPPYDSAPAQGPSSATQTRPIAPPRVVAPVQAKALPDPTSQFQQVAARSPAFRRLPADDQGWVLQQTRHAWASGQIRSGVTEAYDYIDQLSGVRMFAVEEREAPYEPPSESL